MASNRCAITSSCYKTCHTYNKSASASYQKPPQTRGNPMLHLAAQKTEKLDATTHWFNVAYSTKLLPMMTSQLLHLHLKTYRELQQCIHNDLYRLHYLLTENVSTILNSATLCALCNVYGEARLLDYQAGPENCYSLSSRRHQNQHKFTYATYSTALPTAWRSRNVKKIS